MICSECGKEVVKTRVNQKTCLEKECVDARLRRQKTRYRQENAFNSRSTARICLVCRRPLPETAAPNQRTHPGECTDIWRKYCSGTQETDGMTSTLGSLSDAEYIALEMEPPHPGFTKCLGHGWPSHEFWSPDTRHIRICQKCKELAEHGRIIHHPGSIRDLLEEFKEVL